MASDGVLSSLVFESKYALCRIEYDMRTNSAPHVINSADMLCCSGIGVSGICIDSSRSSMTVGRPNILQSIFSKL